MTPRKTSNRGDDGPHPLWAARQLQAHPRLLASIAFVAAAYFLLPHHWSIGARAMMAFDAGALLFLGLAWSMMRRAGPDRMRQRARREDAGRWAVLALAVAAGAAGLLAIGSELRAARELEGAALAYHVALTTGTIALSWFFVHTNFALRYAHEYYGDAGSTDGTRGGLEFPGGQSPDYWDFLYFSFVIGATSQVSDVQVTGRGLRRLVLAHGVLAFIFNTMILALAINIAAGLI